MYKLRLSTYIVRDLKPSLGAVLASEYYEISYFCIPSILDFDALFISLFSAEELADYRIMKQFCSADIDWESQWYLLEQVEHRTIILYYFDFIVSLVFIWYKASYLVKLIEIPKGWIISNPKSVYPAGRYINSLRIVSWFLVGWYYYVEKELDYIS